MKKTLIITLPLVALMIIGGAIYWQKYQQQQYHELKLIKMDACIAACPNRFDLGKGQEAEVCREKCREKYGVTWEEFNLWRNQ